MKKGDWLLITAVLIAAAAIAVGYFPKKDISQYSTVQIYQNGELYQELSLEKDTVLEITGNYTNHITIKDGKVSVTESNCPGNDCVHMGWLFEGNRSIVCLPNKVEIRLSANSEIDFVVQ